MNGVALLILLSKFFYHDSQWSNAWMIPIKYWGGGSVREENIASYCKIISKSACCWLFWVFFCWLLVGSGCCRLCLTCCRLFVSAHCWVVSGRFVLVGHFRLFLALVSTNIKWFLSYSKNYICKFMQVNLWHHKLFHFHLPFWIWKVWKGREKVMKIWISWKGEELFWWNKNNFHSF